MNINKINRKILVVVSLLITVVLLMGFSNEEKYKKLIESFDVYSGFIRVLEENYYMDLDASVILDNAIMGILMSLDPYTVFYHSDETKEVELITEGTYTGFGISVREIDSLLTIVAVFKDSPAHKSGLKIGDVLYKIDSNNIINIDGDSLSNFTNGKENSIADVRVIRGKDTITKEVIREKIDNPDVSYTELFENKIGYIRLEQFTAKSPMEVLNAIEALHKQADTLNGLIFDLRYNPGGVIQSAVEICDYFLPPNEVIVTTKKENSEVKYDFKTENIAIESDLRLLILIDESTASSSEIMAGALQDLDRAVIVGTESFGKGLVQSFFTLPHDNTMKITTAKYYTPSGRCIQKKQYAKNYIKNSADTVKQFFTTKNGRKIKDASGITPDSIVDLAKYDNQIKELYANNVIFKFAVNLCRKYEKIPENLDDNLVFKDFIAYLDTINYEFQNSYASRMLEEVEDEYEENAAVNSKLEELKKIIIKENKKLIAEDKEDIMLFIYETIYEYFNPEINYFDYVQARDTQLNIAKEIIQSVKYNELLLNKIQEDENATKHRN